MEGEDPLSDDSRRASVQLAGPRPSPGSPRQSAGAGWLREVRNPSAGSEVDSIAPTLRENLTPELRDAFTRTFEEGHDLPERRTTAREWHALLDSYCLRLHDGCPNNPEHYFLGASCPWCAQSSPGSGEQEQGQERQEEEQEEHPSRHLTRSGRMGIAALLAAGIVAAWYVAGRMDQDPQALPSRHASAAPPPSIVKVDAAVHEPAQHPIAAVPQNLVRVLADQRSPGRRAHAIALPGGHGWRSRGTLRRGLHGPRV